MRRFVAILAASVLILSLAGPALATSGSAGGHGAHYYVSLGDSLAAGQQPIGDPDNMYRTNQGYADQLYRMARAHDRQLRHVKLGCPGETTATMMSGGICPYRHGSQLAEAMAFIAAHPTSISFITIDIGWNDFPCQDSVGCVPPGVALIQKNLPTILGTLRGAAPTVPIVGMNLYDPFLAFWLKGDPATAQLSVAAITGINDGVEQIYAAFGMPVADVEGAFSTTKFSPLVWFPGLGKVPLNVAKMCLFTWICASPPLGPDNHATTLGYFVMARAFAAKLHL
jgi:lysophospholipase L1-like esterase